MLENVRFAARDGFDLAGTTFGGASRPRYVALLAPATAVKRSLYRAFAEYHVERGGAALTWDWRGTGGSRPPSLRGFEATMRQWGEQDLGGAIDFARRRWADTPLAVVGHSFGGQAPGLAPNADALRLLVLVAAQSGYWGHWPAPRKYLYAILWWLWFPAVTRLCGFYPGSRFGGGEDLPRGVALEWARWCRSSDFLGDWRGHAALHQPLLAFGFADDPYATPRAVEALYRQYGGTDRTLRFPAPSEAGVPRLGHFGFFRPAARRLWEEVGAWIDSRLD